MKMNKREKIWLRDNKKCSICGAELHIDKERYNDNYYCQLDHIVPKSLGGSNSELNLRAVCRPCNGKRQNKSGKRLIDLYTKRTDQSNIGSDFAHFKFDVENNLISKDELTKLKNQIEKTHQTNIKLIDTLLNIGGEIND